MQQNKNKMKNKIKNEVLFGIFCFPKQMDKNKNLYNNTVHKIGAFWVYKKQGLFLKLK